MNEAENKARRRKHKYSKCKSIKFEFNRKTIVGVIIIAAFCILLFWGLNNSDKLLRLLQGLFGIISPLLIGLCLAFIINAVLKPLERLWNIIFKRCSGRISQRLKRPICLLTSTLIVFGALFALVFMILPEFNRTIGSFAEKMPDYLSKLDEQWNKIVLFARGYGVVLPEFALNTDELMGTVSSFIKNNDGEIINLTLGIATSIFSGIVNAILGLAFSLYILAQKEKLSRNIKNTLFAFYPKKKVNRFFDFAQLTNRMFSNFVTGQFTEAVVIGVLCFIGMLVFRMPYAAVISLLVGATALIPIVGAFLGTAIGAVLILLVNPIQAVWFVIFIIVLQQLESNLIYPKVVGKSVGLPGIWVLAAVTIGGGLFGVMGMLLGVPICAVVYCILKETVAQRLKQKSGESEEKIIE